MTQTLTFYCVRKATVQGVRVRLLVDAQSGARMGRIRYAVSLALGHCEGIPRGFRWHRPRRSQPFHCRGTRLG